MYNMYCLNHIRNEDNVMSNQNPHCYFPYSLELISNLTTNVRTLNIKDR